MQPSTISIFLCHSKAGPASLWLLRQLRRRLPSDPPGRTQPRGSRCRCHHGAPCVSLLLGHRTGAGERYGGWPAGLVNLAKALIYLNPGGTQASAKRWFNCVPQHSKLETRENLLEIDIHGATAVFLAADLSISSVSPLSPRSPCSFPELESSNTPTVVPYPCMLTVTT